MKFQFPKNASLRVNVWMIVVFCTTFANTIQGMAPQDGRYFIVSICETCAAFAWIRGVNDGQNAGDRRFLNDMRNLFYADVYVQVLGVALYFAETVLMAHDIPNYRITLYIYLALNYGITIMKMGRISWFSRIGKLPNIFPYASRGPSVRRNNLWTYAAILACMAIGPLLYVVPMAARLMISMIPVLFLSDSTYKTHVISLWKTRQAQHLLRKERAQAATELAKEQARAAGEREEKLAAQQALDAERTRVLALQALEQLAAQRQKEADERIALLVEMVHQATDNNIFAKIDPSILPALKKLVALDDELPGIIRVIEQLRQIEPTTRAVAVAIIDNYAEKFPARPKPNLRLVPPPPTSS